MSNSEQNDNGIEEEFDDEEELPWHVIVDRMEKHVVRIETPDGSGTGFLFYYYGDVKMPGIATASHVVNHARLWQTPIRIHQAGKSELIKEEDRAIVSNRDASIIWISKPLEDLELPEEPVQLLPADLRIKVGVEVGWLGFPWGTTAPAHFFFGKIAHFNEGDGTYSIDGTAINGVSGGPLFYPDSDSPTGFYVIGSISAYIANRATGETLPGLSVAQAVSVLQEVVPDAPEEGEEETEEAEEAEEAG